MHPSGSRRPTARGDLVRGSSAELTGRWEPGIAGEPIHYVEQSYSMEESWELLSSGTRQWAQKVAGKPILDPFSGDRRIYWHCDVDVSEPVGPVGVAVSAEYRLVLFGEGSLAAAIGTCSNFRSGQINSWRNTRWPVFIDPSDVRNDHRRGTPPGPAGAPGNEGQQDQVLETKQSLAARYLPQGVRLGFGNLSVETQRFLLDRFIGTCSVPQYGRLEPTTQVGGRRYVETYVCYLFNKRYVGFAFAQRSVPYRTSTTGSYLWNDSREAQDLRSAPWDVAAWTSRVKLPTADVVRSQVGPQ